MLSRSLAALISTALISGAVLAAQTSIPATQGPIDFTDAEYPVIGSTDLYSFDQPFIQLHGLADFDMAKEGLDPIAVDGFLGRLRTTTGGVVDGQGLIQVALYCAAGANNAQGPVSEVRAVSLVRQYGDRREFHTFYAFDQASDHYLEDPVLSTWLNGPITLSSLFLMHFGALPSTGGLYSGNSAIVLVDAAPFGTGPAPVTAPAPEAGETDAPEGDDR